MTGLSQRDTRWKNTKLGTSDTTIGSHGCTITALTMLAGLDRVDDVNDRLNKVNGYLRGNLLIWSKIEEAIPWLKFIWRGYSYDNEAVKQAIEDYGGCLVEVDFDGTPMTCDKHWVLYIGDGKMYDPWTGTERSTNVYSLPTGYAIIKTEGEDMSEELETCLTDRKKFWDERNQLYEALGEDNQTDALAEIKRLQKKETECDNHTCPECPECPIVPPVDNDFGEETGTKAVFDKNGVLLGYEKTYKSPETP